MAPVTSPGSQASVAIRSTFSSLGKEQVEWLRKKNECIIKATENR